MRRLRLARLPEDMRREIRNARRERGWSQLELGRRAGLAQRHVSGLETGRIVPRYDTLLDVLRVLDRDLVVTPRAFVPVVRALVRDHRNGESIEGAGERSLYAVDDGGEGDEAGQAYGDEEEDGGFGGMRGCGWPAAGEPVSGRAGAGVRAEKVGGGEAGPGARPAAVAGVRGK